MFDTFGAEKQKETIKFSGGETCSGNPLSKSTQIISRGIYLFSVEEC